MVAPVIAAAAIGAVASGAQAAYQSSQIQGANKQTRKFAREVRAWEEEMANTAHQREVADLRAAGLNPILSGTGGSGAGVPGAPMATSLPEVGTASVGEGAASAARAYQESKLLEANTDKATSDASTADSQAKMAMIELSRQATKQQYEMGGLSGHDLDIPLIRGFRADLDARVGAAGIAQGQASQQPQLAEQLRAQVRAMAQQLNIGASAEAKAQVDTEINKSTIGELLMWLDRFSKSFQGIR